MTPDPQKKKRVSEPRSQPESRVRRPRSAHHTLLFGVAKNKRAIWTVVAGVTLAIALMFAVVVYTDLSWEQVMAVIDRANPVAVLPLMAFLPIVGFPISVMYLFAGARFGALGGGVVVAAVTVIHLVGTYAIARSFFREPLRRFIARRHMHLPEVPEDEQAMVCVIATLVPGLPYVVRNYLLALAGLRLKFLLAVCVPIYVARSYVTILLGDMGNEPSERGLLILLAIEVLKFAICAWVIWRLRAHHRKFHGHEHDHQEHEPDASAPPGAAA